MNRHVILAFEAFLHQNVNRLFIDVSSRCVIDLPCQWRLWLRVQFERHWLIIFLGVVLMPFEIAKRDLVVNYGVFSE